MFDFVIDLVFGPKNWDVSLDKVTDQSQQMDLDVDTKSMAESVPYIGSYG